MNTSELLTTPQAHWRRALRRAPEGVNPGQRLRLRPGTIHDYDALGAFHYRAGRPATFVRVITLRAAADALPAAVLVVSMPTLNGAWRRAAFPEMARLLDANDKRAIARWINANLRTISRVVVEPRWRGLGLAQRLVRSYLRRPLTRCTESVATMGAYCPFFVAAGMIEHPCAMGPREARLARLLAREGVRVESLGEAVRRSARLAQDLRRWARSSRRTQRVACGDIAGIVRAAQSALLARPIAFTHVSRLRT